MKSDVALAPSAPLRYATGLAGQPASILAFQAGNPHSPEAAVVRCNEAGTPRWPHLNRPKEIEQWTRRNP